MKMNRAHGRNPFYKSGCYRGCNPYSERAIALTTQQGRGKQKALGHPRGLTPQASPGWQ